MARRVAGAALHLSAAGGRLLHAGQCASTGGAGVAISYMARDAATDSSDGREK